MQAEAGGTVTAGQGACYTNVVDKVPRGSRGMEGSAVSECLV